MMRFRPCPFCGSPWLEIHAGRAGIRDRDESWIECVSCGCRMVTRHHGCVDTPIEEIVERLIDNWNMRAERKDMKKEGEKEEGE